jgi:hypothetical protein
MVTKKTVKKPAVKRVAKGKVRLNSTTHDMAATPKELLLAEELEEAQNKFEMAVVGLRMAKASMELMSKKYKELFKAYEQAIKHIHKLEKKAK